MKGRHAHVGALGQAFDPERFGVVLTQKTQRRADPGKMPLLLHQRPQHAGLWPTQGGVEHLTHSRRAQHLGIERVLQARQQTLDAGAHGCIKRRGGHRLWGLRLHLGGRWQVLYQFGQYIAVDVHRHTQQWRLGSGEGLAHERHRQGLHQVMPGAIFERAWAQACQLAALGEDHQARLVDLRAAGHIVIPAQHVHLGQMSGYKTRARGQGADQGAQGSIGVDVAGQLHGGTSSGGSGGEGRVENQTAA